MKKTIDMKWNNYLKSYSLLKLTIIIALFTLSTTISVYAQNQTTEELKIGITKTDQIIFDKIIKNLDDVVDTQKSVFHTRKTPRTEELTDADKEVMEVIKRRSENEKNEEKNKIEQKTSSSNSMTSKIKSYSAENIKKVYHVKSTWREDLNTGASITDIYGDKYFWLIPCQTESIQFPYSYIYMHDNGIDASSMDFEEVPTFLSNTEIYNKFLDILEPEEGIVSLNYFYDSIPLYLNVAHIMTSNDNEYVLLFEEPKRDIGLNKGQIYTAEEFINYIKEYQPTSMKATNEKEISAGIGETNKNPTNENNKVLGCSIIGMLISLGGFFVTKSI